MALDDTTLVQTNLVDYDALFFMDPDAKVIPCGEQSTISKSQSKEHIQSMFQDGTKDLNFVATCECGNLVGNFYEGVQCSKCGTVVKTNFAEKLKYRVWLEIPEFCPPILHPVFYSVFDRWLGNCDRINIMTSLLNIDTELPPTLAKFGLGQGFKYFYENFDDIVNFFLNNFPPLKSTSARKKSVGIFEFVQKYRHIAFIRHIPILNQALHLLTASGTMMYSDDCCAAILNCKIELSNLIYLHQNGPTNHKFLDLRLWEVYNSFIEYVKAIEKFKLYSKSGYIRKMVLGARIHCSARAVIVPITEEHHYDEIHLPWKLGVTILKLEIINVLMNRHNYTMPEALAKHSGALAMYDQDIDNILQILINECKEDTGYRGLPFLVGRNPTLRLCSIQLLFATKIKTDFNDDTLGISPLIVTAPNADYDGDAMYSTPIKEMDMVPTLMRIHPCVAALGGDSPGISGDICITKQAAINLNCWLNDLNE